MGAEFWAAVAAIAAAVSAALALRTVLTEARSSDFRNCIDVVTSLAEAQRRVRDSKTDAERLFELRELLNLMEALALLENDKRLGQSTRKSVRDFLEQAWAYLKVDPALWPIIQSSITGEETFAELMKFAKRRESRINALADAYRKSTPTP